MNEEIKNKKTQEEEIENIKRVIIKIKKEHKVVIEELNTRISTLEQELKAHKESQDLVLKEYFEEKMLLIENIKKTEIIEANHTSIKEDMAIGFKETIESMIRVSERTNKVFEEARLMRSGNNTLIQRINTANETIDKIIETTNKHTRLIESLTETKR
jgi:hypothetical protein